MTKQASDVFHFGLNPRPWWRSKWGEKKRVDLRGERTELCVSAAKSCSHMTTKDSKMPLRKTFRLYSSTVAVRNSCHVKLWPRKNVQRGIKPVKEVWRLSENGKKLFFLAIFLPCVLSNSLLFYFCPSVSCFPSPCSGFQECAECPYLYPGKHEGVPAAETKFLCRSQPDRSGMAAQYQWIIQYASIWKKMPQNTFHYRFIWLCKPEFTDQKCLPSPALPMYLDKLTYLFHVWCILHVKIPIDVHQIHPGTRHILPVQTQLDHFIRPQGEI